MENNWMQKYDYLSAAQIIMDLASLQSKKRKKIPLDKTREVLDVLIDRATAAEGVHHPSEGEFYNILEELTGIRKYAITEEYQSRGVISNQFDKLKQSIAFVEQYQKNYFTLTNLTQVFGKEDARYIHQKVSQIKNPKDTKGKFNEFAQKSSNQTCSLEMLVIKDIDKSIKNGLPLMTFLKKGKDADSFTRKIAKYITEKLPFIEVTQLGKMDAFFPLGLYVDNPELFMEDEKVKSYFTAIPDDEFNDFLQTYHSWKSAHKSFIQSREKLAHLEDNGIRGIKNGKEIKKYNEELITHKTTLQTDKERKEQAEKEVQLAYQQIQPLIEESIGAKSKEENEEFMEKMFFELGNIKDLRGIGLVMLDVPKNYVKRIIENPNYIVGSYEDHAEKKRERNSDYEGKHAQFVARRFENNVERNDEYSLVEQLEVQVNSLDNFVKSLFGKFNHTDYHQIREQQTLENFSKEQKAFYENIIMRLNSINASQRTNDPNSLEKIFERLYDVRMSGRKNIEAYEEKLYDESKVLNTKWNLMI